MKELSRDAKAITSKDKDKHRDKDQPAAADCEVESVKTTGESMFQRTRSLRLFRTPSLPKRLRFNRQNTDLTTANSAAKTLFATPAPTATPVAATIVVPAFSDVATSPMQQAQPEQLDHEQLAAIQTELRNKTEVLLECEQQIDELRAQLHAAKQTSAAQTAELVQRNQRIDDLESELRGNNEGIDMLRDIAHKSCAKVEELELEIRQILQNHENETDVLLAQKNATEVACERACIERKLLNEEVVVLKKELLHLHEEIGTVKRTLDADVQTLNEHDAACKRAQAENARNLHEIETLRRQTDADMVAYVEESQKMMHELDALRRHKLNVSADLALKEELIRGLHEELAGRDIDQDELRAELRTEMHAAHADAVATITQRYDEQIAVLHELHAGRIAELESGHAADRAQLVQSHTDLVRSLQSQLDRSTETAEEKIRISEVQTEQRLKALESSVEQTVGREKALWLTEMDKCQKIAETEIMQCEFEKQDLKTLLDAANDLLREKDDRIDELQTLLGNEMTKFVQCRDSFEQQLNESRREYANLMTEKFNYHLTLNNTQSAVAILVDRLKKSDSDVEDLTKEVAACGDAMLAAEARHGQELQRLQAELEEYRNALRAVRNSSLALERAVKEKDSAFEQLLSAEEETLGTVDKIGRLFNDKIEEKIVKYFELYTELKLKYDARESYVLEMKTWMDEFASGINLARLELDEKNAKLNDLQEENRNIKLENMTYRFKCEQYENDTLISSNGERLCESQVSADDDGLVSTAVIANIINQLESESTAAAQQQINMGLYSDEDKITAENNMLKEKLAEKTRQIDMMQNMLNMDETLSSDKTVRALIRYTIIIISISYSISTTHFLCIPQASLKDSTQKQIDHLKDINTQLKNVSVVSDEYKLQFVSLSVSLTLNFFFFFKFNLTENRCAANRQPRAGERNGRAEGYGQQQCARTHAAQESEHVARQQRRRHAQNAENAPQVSRQRKPAADFRWNARRAQSQHSARTQQLMDDARVQICVTCRLHCNCDVNFECYAGIK